MELIYQAKPSGKTEPLSASHAQNWEDALLLLLTFGVDSRESASSCDSDTNSTPGSFSTTENPTGEICASSNNSSASCSSSAVISSSAPTTVSAANSRSNESTSSMFAETNSVSCVSERSSSSISTTSSASS